MGKDEAQKAVQSLKIKLGLSVTPGVNAQPAALQPVPKAGNTVIYKYTDKSGVIHFTDRYETIPEEYRAGIQMNGEVVQPPPSAGPADEGTQTPGNNYIPNPGPEVVNNYYYSYGPRWSPTTRRPRLMVTCMPGFLIPSGVPGFSFPGTSSSMIFIVVCSSIRDPVWSPTTWLLRAEC